MKCLISQGLVFAARKLLFTYKHVLIKFNAKLVYLQLADYLLDR